MQLTVFNGSPRTKKGNTAILIGDMEKGFTSQQGNSIEILYLNNGKRRQEAAERFAASEIMIVAFPLYVHAMPGIVMTWLEMLEPHRERRPKLGFVVQGGLPEARQSRFVEPFLERLPARLGCEYLGTVIRGGVEAMQFAPAFMFRRMRENFVALGRSLSTDGKLDHHIVEDLARPEVLPGYRLAFYRTMKALGIADRPWNNMLKANGCWDQRFDKPYAPKPPPE